MQEYRVGLGYDLHRTAPDRPLILANVQIPHTAGLSGHSDADVVLHALIDALTGAAGLPDVGEMFPNTDGAYKNINSARLLEAALNRVHEQRWTINNVDVVIIAQQPKLSPHKAAMKQRLAELLNIAVDRVNVKGKTNEQVDAIGQQRAIACHCVALLTRSTIIDQPSAIGGQ